MELTFVHDGPLFYDEQENYYEFAYHELFERYTYLADNISFLIRTKKIDSWRHYTKVPEEIRVISVPNFKGLKVYFKNKKRAKKIVKEQIKKTDIVVLRTQSSIASLALKYVKKYKKPYIVECVGCSWDTYWNHGIIGKIIAPYMFLEQKKMIREAPYVYYVTNEFLQHRYPTKGKNINCSNVVLGKTDDNILTNRLHRIAMMDNNSLVLGTAAAIDTRYKGHEYVIRAIPVLLDRGIDIVYKLAGGLTGQKQDFYLRDLAEELDVSDHVIFLGSLSAEDMGAYYDDLDIYVQPSKQEGLPRAVIESMSRGCPAIGSDLAGIPELIDKKCLFRPGNTDEFIKVLCDINEKETLKALAINNFIKSKEYEKEKLTHKRKRFYSDFMKNEFGVVYENN